MPLGALSKNLIYSKIFCEIFPSGNETSFCMKIWNEYLSSLISLIDLFLSWERWLKMWLWIYLNLFCFIYRIEEVKFWRNKLIKLNFESRRKNLNFREYFQTSICDLFSSLRFNISSIMLELFNDISTTPHITSSSDDFYIQFFLSEHPFFNLFQSPYDIALYELIKHQFFTIKILFLQLFTIKNPRETTKNDFNSSVQAQNLDWAGNEKKILLEKFFTGSRANSPIGKFSQFYFLSHLRKVQNHRMCS